MARSRPLRVLILGDVGTDLLTLYQTGGPERGNGSFRPAEHAYDVEIPSGAKYSECVLRELSAGLRVVNGSANGSAGGEAAGDSLHEPFDVRHVDLRHDPSRPNGAIACLEPTLDRILCKLAPFRSSKDGKEIYRFREFVSLELGNQKPSIAIDGAGARALHQAMEDSTWVPDVVVIHDGGGGWRAEKENADQSHVERLTDLMRKWFCESPHDRKKPHIIVNIAGELPATQMLSQQTGDSAFEFVSPVWRLLQEKNYRDHVTVLCSVTPLRRAGALINRRLSWECFIEDLATELQLFPSLNRLGQFRHLIVRMGLVGLGLVKRSGEGVSGNLWFAPNAKDGIYRDPDREGRTAGKNTLLIASILYQLAQSSESIELAESLDRVWCEAIPNALRAAMKCFDHGYDVKELVDPTSGQSEQERGQRIVRINAQHAIEALAGRKHTKNERQAPRWYQEIGCVTIPHYLLAVPAPGTVPWHGRVRMLPDALDKSGLSRTNVALAIAMYGLEQVVNRHDVFSDDVWATLTRPDCVLPGDTASDHITLRESDQPMMPDLRANRIRHLQASHDSIEPHLEEARKRNAALWLPIMKFAKLTVVERDEIEGLRSITNLIQNYVNDEKHSDKPLSIAVFGPPGSGKSFAVKQIAETIDADKEKILALDYNVAQFQLASDLGVALTTVASANNSKKLPLVFFDEFDCQFEGRPLGWLKYFLAPMQDGAFYGANQKINIGRAIFVFAGGVHSSFESFDPRSTQQDIKMADGLEVSDDHLRQIREFTEQKGPDFISRLRGHINVLPINTEAGQVKHLMRRAVQLRSLLQMLGLTRVRNGLHEAAVDPNILYALLTVDRYRHGVRSMESILRMCTRTIDRHIELASLPSRSQLHMHVDADEFFIRLYRGRARTHRHETLRAERSTPEPQRGVEPHRDERTAEVAALLEKLGSVRSDLKYVDARVPQADKQSRKEVDATRQLLLRLEDRLKPILSTHPSVETSVHETGEGASKNEEAVQRVHGKRAAKELADRLLRLRTNCGELERGIEALATSRREH